MKTATDKPANAQANPRESLRLVAAVLCEECGGVGTVPVEHESGTKKKPRAGGTDDLPADTKEKPCPSCGYAQLPGYVLTVLSLEKLRSTADFNIELR